MVYCTQGAADKLERMSLHSAIGKAPDMERVAGHEPFPPRKPPKTLVRSGNGLRFKPDASTLVPPLVHGSWKCVHGDSSFHAPCFCILGLVTHLSTSLRKAFLRTCVGLQQVRVAWALRAEPAKKMLVPYALVIETTKQVIVKGKEDLQLT